jgi:hypothetical protein
MTPYFPDWASSFQHELRRLRSPHPHSQAPCLHQFQLLFERWFPHHLFAQQDEGPHSRNRRWTLCLTFWTFLWQVAQVGASCREAIRQAANLCRSSGHPLPPVDDSPYCQARAALPLERLEDLHSALVKEAHQAVAAKDLWCGHWVRVVDGTTVTLPDTPANQKLYPQQSVQRPGCGFPILRLTGLFSLATGLFTAWATGAWRDHELQLLNQLWEHFNPGDVLLGDRGFCTWGVVALCQHHGLHAVVRARGSVRRDFRRGKRLSRDEREVQWHKPAQCPRTIPQPLWEKLPECLTLRLVRCRAFRPGFRTEEVLLVTTLLDRQRYPVNALSELFLRRWEMELSLRHLKTTLQMDQLSCKNPDTIQRELRMHLLVHNLVRRLMLESARHHGVPTHRLSFAGTLAGARRAAEALLQACTQRLRRRLFEDLLQHIATDLVPERPGRREPRAVKRRPKPYPRLTCHRHRFMEIQHQNRYYIPVKLRTTRKNVGR